MIVKATVEMVTEMSCKIVGKRSVQPNLAARWVVTESECKRKVVQDNKNDW